MLEIMNYTGSPQLAVGNMIAWTQARDETIQQARAAHANARLHVLHGFEISLVNLSIVKTKELSSAPASSGRTTDALSAPGLHFLKSPTGEWNALRNVVPRVHFDLLLYSAYESVNSPYQTHNTDVEPSQITSRLRRDLDRIREQSKAALSGTGKQLFGDRYVAVGELGFARERFEQLPSGGLLARLTTSIKAAAAWGCPYIVLWQVFDAPRAGGEPWGFGMIDSHGRAPLLRPDAGGCDSVQSCVAAMLRK
jgi:hypothetical protein